MTEVSLADALSEIRFTMATDERNWASAQGDAFLYGVLVGWECEEDHDETCDDDALTAVARRHFWRSEEIEQVRAIRRAIRAASGLGERTVQGGEVSKPTLLVEPASGASCPTCGSTDRPVRLMVGCGFRCDDPRGWHRGCSVPAAEPVQS